MKKNTILITAIMMFFFQRSMAQLTPEVTSWIINTTNATGYNGIESNVQKVQYSTDTVYVSCSCIPGYSIGPWQGNPNIPKNQNFVYGIPRHPVANPATPIATPLSHIAVWTNGVSAFNAEDGHSYNNAGIWHQNAYYFEGVSFDNCLGHPDQDGEYHHHVNPTCLYNDADSTHHSPIIGYAFDGYPIYGAYAYTNTNGTGAIKRMTTSYQLRNITTRDTLPDGTAASSAGPAVSSTYPLGDYLEDYAYVQGSGDLDAHNGRFCVTPEYPNGTYAYFVTINNKLQPVYPYVLGPTYYGIVYKGDVGGPTSAHVTITESTTTYTPTATNTINQGIKFELTPNPTQDYVYIYFDPNSANNVKTALYDMQGNLLQKYDYFMQPSISYSFDLTKYAAGTYLLYMESGTQHITQKIVKIK